MAELAKSLKTITLCQFLNKTKEFINKEEMLSALVKTQEEDQPKESSKKPWLPPKRKKK
jgi:hypothetical protein